LVATAAWEGAGASAAAAFTPGLGEHGVSELVMPRSPAQQEASCPKERLAQSFRAH
jgi:hypothetical protein